MTIPDAAEAAWNEWLRNRPIAPNQREVFMAGYQAVAKDRDDWIARHGTLNQLYLKAEARVRELEQEHEERCAQLDALRACTAHKQFCDGSDACGEGSE